MTKGEGANSQHNVSVHQQWGGQVSSMYTRNLAWHRDASRTCLATGHRQLWIPSSRRALCLGVAGGTAGAARYLSSTA